MIRHYLEEMFEPTLLYGLSLAVFGVAMASHYGAVSLAYGSLAIMGSVLAQISANVISDYFDYSSGLDRELGAGKKDNLSGGSSLMAKGLIKPVPTLFLGLAIFAAAAAIGIHLLLARPQIIPILIIAAFSILLYSKYAKRIPYLSEPLCTLNYTLISLGVFIVASSTFSLPYGLAFALIPAGILLGGDALFVNEVPDAGIDRKYGVRHSAVMLGTGRRIGLYYLSFQVAAYAIVVAGLLSGFIPMLSLITLLTLPTTIYVYNGLRRRNAKKYGEYLFVHTLSAVVFAVLLSASFLVQW